MLLLNLLYVQDPSVSDQLMPTGRLLQPAGRTLEFNGRPVDLRLSPDGSTIFVKDKGSLRIFDAKTWTEKANVASPGGASGTGLAVSRDGSKVYFTNSGNALHVYAKQPDGTFKLGQSITLAGPNGKGAAYPCGIVLSNDEQTAYIALSRNNAIGILRLSDGKLLKQIPVGIAPYDVERTGKTLVVSNQGGRKPRKGEKTALSSETETPVDERGLVKTGSVSIVDLVQERETKQIEVGLQPCDVLIEPTGKTAYIANANADSVSIVDIQKKKQMQKLVVKPDNKLPFGSMPNALAYNASSKTLYVANAGNNAVATVDVSRKPKVTGFIPSGWYPVALAVRGDQLYIVNNKGIGSRTRVRPEEKGWNSHDHRGNIETVSLKMTASEKLANTKKVSELAKVPQILRMFERRGSSSKAPAPIPAQLGDPSTIDHIIYVIKENRTYDQILGDLPQGEHNSDLCIFGRKYTPNHHAVVEEFVLLDNYYCNGVLSADGHSWATEGNVTPYLDKAFGGFSRSYTFGNDPLTYSSTGFLWDHVLAANLSFRNYGEMNDTTLPTGVTYFDLLKAEQEHRVVPLQMKIEIERVRNYSCTSAPGWNMAVPDVYRMDQFLRELRDFDSTGGMPNLSVIYLPQNHTGGPVTPGAHVADNDLAVGRLIEAVSKTRYWKSTALFINEDDPQGGFDHVDGHRSVCLVASPWAKRGKVVSKFYNQTSVLHTICRILGLPPMNQAVASSPIMFDCFTSKGDFREYKARPNQIPLDQKNPPKETLTTQELRWEKILATIPMHKTGLKTPKDEDNLTRYVWHRMKGFGTKFPSQFVGPHATGLKKLGLKHGGKVDDDD